MKQKRVVILGSTGSIGRSALDSLRHMKQEFRVLGLSANSNLELIQEQIREFNPTFVSMEDSAAAVKLTAFSMREKIPFKVLNHKNGMEELASRPDVDVVLCGVVGGRGLLPLLSAIKKGKTIGLANKEALIIAGELIQRLAKKHKATIIPVDSEHSAIYHCLEGKNPNEVSRIILTASGGPFYRRKESLDSISVDEALNHPTWKMGRKITIDSATLMNKGLEAIEAHFLFNIPMDKISIVIHPQSIVHSLVEFCDGSMLAQLSHPDMRLPIQYALTHPHRQVTPIKKLKLEDIKTLEFASPDFSRFPCLQLALEAGRKGGTYPTVLSASNEIAVEAFLSKRISFNQISTVVKTVLDAHIVVKATSLSTILEVDRWAKNKASAVISKMEKEKILCPS